MLAGIVAAVTLLPATAVQASNERALYIHYTHTKETARIVFKKNGQYVQSGLNELNVFLRDWRRNEPARMDPALFDLLWEVYQETGSNQPIHVVSAYRSPATNAMLASRSSGVANNSQHMAGRAIDFFIPGVPVSKIREIGFRKQVGGVGYYPSSGTAFVHLDTGSVRAWPRMTTAQLQQIFPDGRTLHVPSNGVVLSQEGYRAAQADYQRCGRVPCSGNSRAGSSSDTQTASANPPRNLWDMLTGNNNRSQQAAAPQPAATQAPTSRAVASVPVQQVAYAPPPPPARPAAFSTAQAAPQNIPFAVIESDAIGAQISSAEAVAAVAIAPVPPAMSRTLAELRSATPSRVAPSASNEGALAIAALDQQPPARPQFEPAVTATAYAAPNARIEATPEARPVPVPAMRPAIAAIPAPAVTPPSDPAVDSETILAASMSPQMGLDSFADLFSGPILPMDGKPDAATANALAALSAREGELFAPDLDHVFTHPASFNSAQYALFSDPDNADFNPATQLGNGTHNFGFARTASVTPEPSGSGESGTIWVRLQ